MIENVTPLIDSLEIRLSDIFEFEDVEFQCPAGGGMVPPIPPVNRNFHAVAKYTSPDTAAINCRLEPTVGGGTPKYPGPAQHNGGEDVFPFALSLSDCSPPLYALKADGNISHSTAIIQPINIVATGGETCLSYIFLKPGLDRRLEDTVRFESIIFRGARPVDSDGNPMPCTISGMVPAAFTVGGPLPPSGKTPKVTLTPDDSVESAPQTKIEDGRWSHRFSNVPKGAYTLKVEADCEPPDTLQIIIKDAMPPDDTAG